jgi:hypothetical protein
LTLQSAEDNRTSHALVTEEIQKRPFPGEVGGGDLVITIDKLNSRGAEQRGLLNLLDYKRRYLLFPWQDERPTKQD